MIAPGLTDAEARLRLRQDGPNELPRARGRSTLRILVDVLREPMLALLLVAGAAYLMLGDRTEALILLAFATFSVAITVVQETRTEHVLEALRDLSAPHALVVRDGVRCRIAGREVVRGDMVVLEQGDRVPADARLVEASDLQVDESLLTGESLPVGKRPGGDGTPSPDESASLVYSGTLVTRGSGRAEVIATGGRSQIGRIGLSLAEVEPEAPRLRTETTRIIRLCAFGGLAISLLVVLLYGVLRGGWIDAVLAGIATGMAMLPEEFPVVLTVFLAMGAWRIGKAGVLTRRAAAIETLGSATILCTDKTGTLTENRMGVAELWLPTDAVHRMGDGGIPAAFHPLIDTAALASPETPIDPMEVALHDSRSAIEASLPPHADWTLAHVHGLRPDLLAMSNIWSVGDGRSYCVAAKGAPEAIAALCRLSPSDRDRMAEAVDAMASRGIRVLGVASATVSTTPDPAGSQRDYSYALEGLVGLADPLRPHVADAIAQCRAAGIRVFMITGDHATTARSIATQAGIDDGDTMTGTELAALDEPALALRLATVTVFARILPDQKLRVVRALQTRGEIVAMTGDGVNDGPSLKAANIGVAMGKRGTDVAREAAAIVLLDDDFVAIVAAIRLGRRIYDNIRKAMAFIFAVHVPIAGLALLPLVTGLPMLFGPIHIALLEMIIDPVCALVFEAEREEPGLMRRPPRPTNAALFSWPLILWSVAQGALALLGCAAIFLGASWAGYSADQTRGLTFLTLVAAILVLILANRAFGTSLVGAFVRGNRVLRSIILAIAGIAALIVAIPAIRRMLGFGTIAPGALLASAAVSVTLLLMLEGLKRIVHPASRS
jgi:Ca2+-transporting ATPase